MAKTKAATNAESRQDTVVYVGPNRLTEGLKTYTVYRGAPQALIDTLAVKYPTIARLFVGVDDLGQAMADVKKKGNPLYLSACEVKGGDE